jgi:hypothetical protein
MVAMVTGWPSTILSAFKHNPFDVSRCKKKDLRLANKFSFRLGSLGMSPKHRIAGRDSMKISGLYVPPVSPPFWSFPLKYLFFHLAANLLAQWSSELSLASIPLPDRVTAWCTWVSGQKKKPST